jgi:hypothetical protein
VGLPGIRRAPAHLGPHRHRRAGTLWGAPLIARELETGTAAWPGTSRSPGPGGWPSSSPSSA